MRQSERERLAKKRDRADKMMLVKKKLNCQHTKRKAIAPGKMQCMNPKCGMIITSLAQGVCTQTKTQRFNPKKNLKLKENPV